MLLNCGGVRAVVTEDKCLLFEPASPASRKFLEIVVPKIQSAGERGGGSGVGRVRGLTGEWLGGWWVEAVGCCRIHCLEITDCCESVRGGRWQQAAQICPAPTQ